MNFTNADLSTIKDFLHYLSYLIDISLCKATLRFNDKIGYELIRKVKSELISLGLKERNIKDKPATRIRRYTIRIWVSNSILGEVLNNMMNKARKRLIEEKSNGREVVYFLQGLISGDGTFQGIRDKYGSLHSRLGLFEANKDFIEDYKKLLDCVNISGNIKKSKNKNLYTYNATLNWDVLLNILKLGLLEKSADNHQRLIRTIKSHRNYKFGWLKDKDLLGKINCKVVAPI